MNDRDVHAYAAFPREQLSFFFATVPISQGGLSLVVEPYAGIPAGQPPLGQLWQVENVQYFCTAFTATATLTVRVGGVIDFIPAGTVIGTAGAVVQVALTANPYPARRQPLGRLLQVIAGSDGTGTVTNLVVTVTIRPFPMVGDA